MICTFLPPQSKINDLEILFQKLITFTKHLASVKLCLRDELNKYTTACHPPDLVRKLLSISFMIVVKSCFYLFDTCIGSIFIDIFFTQVESERLAQDHELSRQKFIERMEALALEAVTIDSEIQAFEKTHAGIKVISNGDLTLQQLIKDAKATFLQAWEDRKIQLTRQAKQHLMKQLNNGRVHDMFSRIF